MFRLFHPDILHWWRSGMLKPPPCPDVTPNQKIFGSTPRSSVETTSARATELPPADYKPMDNRSNPIRTSATDVEFIDIVLLLFFTLV